MAVPEAYQPLLRALSAETAISGWLPLDAVPFLRDVATSANVRGHTARWTELLQTVPLLAQLLIDLKSYVRVSYCCCCCCCCCSSANVDVTNWWVAGWFGFGGMQQLSPRAGAHAGAGTR